MIPQIISGSFAAERRSSWVALLPISLVVIALIFAGWTILIAQAIHAANESVCHSNLFKIYKALITYDDVHGSLPPAHVDCSDETRLHSWRVLILPYLDSLDIDAQGIHNAYDFSQPWNSQNNRVLPKPVVRSRFICPCGNDQQTTLTNYVVLCGPGTLFPGSEGVRLSAIPVSSDPILVIEIVNSNVNWSEPRDLMIESLSSLADANSVRLSGSHGGGIRYITVRGRLGILPAGTDVNEIRRLAQSGIR
jgi:hypothetical protein